MWNSIALHCVSIAVDFLYREKFSFVHAFFSQIFRQWRVMHVEHASSSLQTDLQQNWFFQHDNCAEDENFASHWLQVKFRKMLLFDPLLIA